MAKKEKQVICRNCKAQIPGGMKICPACGAKIKKPFYKKLWFWVLIVILLIVVPACGKSNGDSPSITPEPSTSIVETQATNNVTFQESTIPEAETTAPEAETTAPTDSTPEETQIKEVSAPASGIRPEFKEAMDSCEAFYEEYCDFLKQYSENPSDIKLLSKSVSMLQDVEKMNKAFDAWDEEELSKEELKYYIDVNNRVLKMLADVAD